MLAQGFSLGLGRSSVIVVRPAGELSDLVVVLAVSPDLVHHGVRGVLREEDGLGHVVIVILCENQNYYASYHRSLESFILFI